MPGAAHEIELKLRLPAGAGAELLRHPALAALRRAPARRAMLRSVYFDTPDRQLARAGVAVRLRKSGRDWLQTVKGPATAESGGGLAQRVECEWRLARTIGRPPIDLAKLADTPYRRTIEAAMRHASLVPLFATEFVRTTIALGFPDATTALLCLDQGVVHPGERGSGAASDSIFELELELGTGSPARLFELAAALSADLAIAVETRSKAERGYALVAPKRATPMRAAPLELADNASGAEAMAAILRNCLRQIESNADGVRFDDDPEWIHQMRVGVRRLRSALALMRTALPPDSIAPLDDELRWLADVLGRARDLDVFRGEVLPAIAQVATSSPEHAATIDALTERASAQAVAARDEVRAAVASVRFTRIELATGWLAAGLGAGEGPTDGADLAVPARSFAVERLARRHRKLERAGARLADGSPDERHQARIAAKKMRYAAEFFEPLFDNKRVRAFRRSLARLQEELGAFNDASVAATLASDLCGSASRAAALAAGWAAARFDARDKKLARAWRGFTRAGAFWTGD